MFCDLPCPGQAPNLAACLAPQVAKAFVRLRNGLPAVTPDRAAAYAAAAARQYHSFRGVPEEAWPLFLSSKQHLHMLDGESMRAPLLLSASNGGSDCRAVPCGCAWLCTHSPCLITPPGRAGTLKRPFFKRHPDGSFFFESGKAAQHSNWHRACFVCNDTFVAAGSGQR